MTFYISIRVYFLFITFNANIHISLICKKKYVRYVIYIIL